MIIRFIKTPVVLLTLFAWLMAASSLLRAAPKVVGAVAVELIAETTAVVPGERFNLALDFKLEPHWHLYWKNPGASGLPVEIEWQLPAGLSAGEIQWPAPERIELGGLMNYGYEDAVTLMVPIQVAEDLTLGAVMLIQAEVSWLVCEQFCMPGDATLSLELPVRSEAGSSTEAPTFGAARARLPELTAPWRVSAVLEGQELLLNIEQSSGATIPSDLYFYANQEGVIEPSAVQTLSSIGEGQVQLRAELDSAQLQEPSATVAGVLQSQSGNWTINLSIGAGAAGVGPESLASSAPAATGFEGVLLNFGLPGWLLLAFLGGLILNVMPCVLPVLSLKVFSLLKHSGQSKAQALLHGATRGG
jgi:DsbC/DsbD-like thiol-disulfide interchange protein